MKLLFVVQRYGNEVAGGAEAACREMAWRLAARGHEVHAVTSCAQSYVDWANAYPEGDTTIDGVAVHRLAVAHARDNRFFGPLNGRAVWGRKPTPLFLQAAWMRAQGPDVPALVPWLRANAAAFDVVVFVTYLYATTWAGLPEAAALAPTILLPAAHDEPPFWLPLFDTTLRMPTAYAFLTEEEQALVESPSTGPAAARARSSASAWISTWPAMAPGSASCSGWANARTCCTSAGLDPGKGSDELYDYFTTYKALQATRAIWRWWSSANR